MKKLFVLLTLPITLYVNPLNAQNWSVDAEYAESCSCNAPCPCLLGLDPTYGECIGNSVVYIKKGHYDSVKLDGLKILVTFNLDDWSRVYIDEKATDAQKDAMIKLLQQHGTVRFLFSGKILSVERAPINIEESDSTFTYYAPNSYAKLRYLIGAGGKPLSLANLIGNAVADNKLCVSVDNYHKGDANAFDYVGRHGLVSHFTASSDKWGTDVRVMNMKHHKS